MLVQASDMTWVQVSTANKNFADIPRLADIDRLLDASGGSRPTAASWFSDFGATFTDLKTPPASKVVDWYELFG